MRPLARIAIGLVRIYQIAISPVLYGLGVRCRHEPTCSSYACAAFSRYGFWMGGWLTAARLLRCRPGGSSGYDPVPERLGNERDLLAWRQADWRGPAHNGKTANDGRH